MGVTYTAVHRSVWMDGNPDETMARCFLWCPELCDLQSQTSQVSPKVLIVRQTPPVWLVGKTPLRKDVSHKESICCLW